MKKLITPRTVSLGCLVVSRETVVLRRDNAADPNLFTVAKIHMSIQLIKPK